MSRRPEIEVIARGVLTDAQGRVLLCQNLKHRYYYLPGGHVEFGESAEAALVREFDEETGVKVVCRELLAAGENVFQRGEETFHEVNVIFRVELADGATVAETFVSLEPKIAFAWVSRKKIEGTDLRPAGVKTWLVGTELGAAGTWIREEPRSH